MPKNRQPPVEFQMGDYDDAVRTSPHPQTENQRPATTNTPDTLPETPVVPENESPHIKQEPQIETTPPKSTKGQRELKNLDSKLDGHTWECTETHRPRLRVRTTGVEEESEYQDSWNNIVPIPETETQEEILVQKDS